MTTLSELGVRAYREGRYEEALAALAEAVRRQPSDHRSRVLAARSLAAMGEPERALTILDFTAEGLANRGYLLSAMLAIKHALRFNPAEKRLKATLRRIHAQAAPGTSRAAVPPALEPLFEGAPGGDDLSKLRGGELTDKAYEVLVSVDEGKQVPASSRPPLPLFADLDADAFVELVERMSVHELTEGQAAVKEGEAGDSLFVVVAGKLKVEREVAGVAKYLASLPGGSLFGELGLLTGAPRSATISAQGDVELFEISKDDVDFVAKDHPGIHKALSEFAGRRVASSLLSTCGLFSGLGQEKSQKVLQRFRPHVVAAGERVIYEGKPTPALYLVVSGEFSVTKKDGAGEDLTLGLLRDGDVFGEISLVSGNVATATVSAVRKSMVASLPREAYEGLVESVPEIEDYLLDLSKKRLGKIAESMKPAEVIDAEDLIIEA